MRCLRHPNSPVIYRHSNQVDSAIYTTVSGSGMTRDYTAFGDQRPGTQFKTVDTAYNYGGQYEDGTGLVYMNARYYDPNMGLFISPDTIIPDPSNVLDYNRYACVKLPGSRKRTNSLPGRGKA